MIDLRIHVGIKTVLVGVGPVPRSGRLARHQLDLDDRLDALEAVFPRHHQADGGTILRRQRLAVHADTQERQRVHGFIQPQALDIGERDAGQLGARQRHLAEVPNSFQRRRTWPWDRVPPV